MCRHNGRQIAIATWICWTCNECVFFWNARIVAKQDSSNQLYQVQWKNWSGKWWINKKWILLGKKIVLALDVWARIANNPPTRPRSQKPSTHIVCKRTHVPYIFWFQWRRANGCKSGFWQVYAPSLLLILHVCFMEMFDEKTYVSYKKCAWRNSITHSRILRILYVS